jgi:hypothetical protein
MRLASRHLIRSVSAVLLGGAVALALGACGPSSEGDDDDDSVDGGTTDDPCDPGEVRCLGSSYQECDDGFFAEADRCDLACDVDLGGCVDCDPDNAEACNGDAVYTCNADGSFGGLVEQCGDSETCENGACTTSCGAAGSDLIYVVDSSYRLLSFDPTRLDTAEDPFELIGNLNCPAGTSLDGLSEGTPFSMSVDRNGTAWVLYNSGQIFHVSTDDASCQSTSFQVEQSNGAGGLWSLFGMGFVSDSPGSDDETLFIAGGNIDVQTPGHLGSVNPTTMQITTIDDMEGGSEYSPELTGTGDAELYGYYPGASTSFIAEISKSTALRGTNWDLPGLGGDVAAWAFAHWGGRFYVFVTVSDIFATNSQVQLVDPMAGGQTTTLLQDLPYIIVGAGVSTCAPVYVP